MGYYTQFSLKMEGKDAKSFFEQNQSLIEAAILGNPGMLGYGFESVMDACFNEWECKWYDHEKHMKAISLLFPDETFILQGVGESYAYDKDDAWTSTYKAGNGTIVYEKNDIDEDLWPWGE